MFWRYILFETKLLLRNWKNWLLGAALILFFPLYFLYYTQLDIIPIKEKKNEESADFMAILDAFPGSVWQTDEGKEIYNILTTQSSLHNMQRFVLWKNKDFNQYIDYGLKLNELRLEMHERGNKGIHQNYIIPIPEIQKEIALLKYYKEHNLPIIQDPYAASNYMPVALQLLSGVLFCLFVLLIASSILLHDQQHPTVITGFPISFMQKVSGKVTIHFFQVLVFFVSSVLIGGYYVSKKTEWGNFKTPVLIYQDADFIAVSMLRYIFYMFVAFALISLLLLLSFILINEITKNMYGTILLLLVVLLGPEFIRISGVESNWLYPLKFIDIGAVLNGDAAVIFGMEKLDFKNSFGWLIGLNLIIIAILYTRNKLLHLRNTEATLKLN